MKILIGALMTLTALPAVGMVLVLLMFTLKFSGVQNIDGWNPENRAWTEEKLKVSLPETLDWKAYREWHSFRDLVIRGEFLATPEELEAVFPMKRFPMEEISSFPSNFPYIPQRPGAQYRYYQGENWEIVVEIVLDSPKIHVWFIRFY